MSVINFVLHGFYAVGFSSDLIIAQIKKPCFFYNSFFASFFIFFHELFSGQVIIYLFHLTVTKQKRYQCFFSAYELVKSFFTVVIYGLLSYGLTIFFSFGKTTQHRCSSYFNSPASSHQNRAWQHNNPDILLGSSRHPLPLALSY